MKKFSEWLEEKDPEVFSEILGTLALGGLAAAAFPKQAGWLAGKTADLAVNVAGHVAGAATGLAADAIKSGAKLAGQGAYHGANLAAKGLRKGAAYAMARKGKPKEDIKSKEVPGTGVSYA